MIFLQDGESKKCNNNNIIGDFISFLKRLNETFTFQNFQEGQTFSHFQTLHRSLGHNIYTFDNAHAFVKFHVYVTYSVCRPYHIEYYNNNTMLEMSKLKESVLRKCTVF